MQLGFVSAILPELSFEDLWAFADAEGFGCVEVMCWPPGKAERRYAGVTHIDVTSLNDAEVKRIRGLVATMSIEASTSTSVLLAYLEQVLVPKLQQVKPDAILVMDNLRPHHATEVRDLLAQAGIGLLYLPRYSPEFNPIEQVPHGDQGGS